MTKQHNCATRTARPGRCLKFHSPMIHLIYRDKLLGEQRLKPVQVVIRVLPISLLLGAGPAQHWSRQLVPDRLRLHIEATSDSAPWILASATETTLTCEAILCRLSSICPREWLDRKWLFQEHTDKAAHQSRTRVRPALHFGRK